MIDATAHQAAILLLGGWSEVPATAVILQIPSLRLNEAAQAVYDSSMQLIHLVSEAGFC